MRRQQHARAGAGQDLQRVQILAHVPLGRGIDEDGADRGDHVADRDVARLLLEKAEMARRVPGRVEHAHAAAGRAVQLDELAVVQRPIDLDAAGEEARGVGVRPDRGAGQRGQVGRAADVVEVVMGEQDRLHARARGQQRVELAIERGAFLVVG
jgi:hypothetical protein